MNNVTLARESDPITSHLAARDIVESGVFETQKEKVLALLEAYNDKYGVAPTSAELARWADLERVVTSRRLPDLEKTKRVKRHIFRTCTISKKLCTTWIAVDSNVLTN